MSAPVLPDRLRHALDADLRPVRPLPSPGRRTIGIVLWAVLLFALVPQLWHLRQDAAALGWLLLWGAAAAEALVGVLLAGLALREAVPGSGVGAVRAAAALALGAATQLTVSLAASLQDPSLTAEEMVRHRGLSCMSMQEALGVSGLALASWLIVRALPVRPRSAGALAGMATALVADAVWHLICPRSDLPHVLGWHGGATALTTAWGWLLGVVYERRAVARMQRSDS